MYALLGQEFPFIADKEEKLYDLIKKAEVKFAKPVWKDVSSAGLLGSEVNWYFLIILVNLVFVKLLSMHCGCKERTTSLLFAPKLSPILC